MCKTQVSIRFDQLGLLISHGDHNRRHVKRDKNEQINEKLYLLAVWKDLKNWSDV